jgi:hypothetical protein
VLAHATGGALDAITDGEDGLLVPVGDPQALAARLSEVLGHPDLLGRMAARCRQTAPGRWRLDRQAADYLALYRDLGAADSNGSGFPVPQATACPLTVMTPGHKAVITMVARERPSGLQRTLRRALGGRKQRSS